MASQSGKQRASRIPLDYFKHPDNVVRRKLWLTAALAGLAVLWIGTLYAVGSRGILGPSRYSHAPVAAVHAPIESDCAACHVDFAVFSAAKPFAGDKKCETCHLGDGLAAHHAGQLASLTPNCGTCHSDHHGRQHSLLRMNDTQCTVCHKDTRAAVQQGTGLRYDEKVNAFAADHQEFRLLRSGAAQDSSRVKFNHKYHMTAGIVLTAGGKPYTLADIRDEAQRERYRRADQRRGDKPDSTYPVRLDCIACHQPERLEEQAREERPDPVKERSRWEEWTRSFFTARMNARGGREAPPKSEAYLAPVVYETHCVACHPLTFDGRISKSVPHRSQPDDLKKFLTTVYEEEYNKSPQSFTARPTAAVALPGKRLGGPAEKPSSEALVRSKVEQALGVLLGGRTTCGECHVDEQDHDLTPLTKAIAKPGIPDRWLTHARFDHGAHTIRGIGCKECHAAAYATNEKDLLEASIRPRRGAEQVMLPGIDACRKCHTPEPAAEVVERGWAAKHDCTECHGYHHGK